MKTKLFLLLLALSVLRTQAQSLSIKGRVTDASHEAVIAANVSLWTIDSTLVTGVTSVSYTHLINFFNKNYRIFMTK